MTVFEAVIGLEVHAQLLTQTKIFCGCATTFGAPPNRHICPVCTGQPGALPVLNRTAVEFAIRAGLATHCTIAPASVFARKNYFYPDLPKGYQISQYDRPLCEHGYLECAGNGGVQHISIRRIHLEEDAGKLLHDVGSVAASHVDLNRAGVPLIEIVSGPDLRTPQAATQYLKTLRSCLMYLDVCDGNMQEGSFRCDANVSIRPAGAREFGTRTELKNLNSFRFLERAIAFEIDRQTHVVEDGGTVVQETRLWNDARGITESMRGKEEAHDYRYFPDPDLLPLAIPPAMIDRIRAELPELAEAKAARYQRELGLSAYDARLLTDEKPLAAFFEAALQEGGGVPARAKKLANWILTELLGRLNVEGDAITESRVTPKALARLVACIDEGRVSGKMAKEIFAELSAAGGDPDTIIRTKGLSQLSDTDALEAVIDVVFAEQTANVAAYRAGKIQLLGFFVGEVMKKTKGQAHPKLVNELLRKKLEVV